MHAAHTPSPGFDAPDVQHWLEQASADAIDELPYGVVRLDPEGLVTLYNATEARLSGFNRGPALGLKFFERVAPCMNTPTMKGLIEAAWRAGTLDLEIGWVGDFADPDREYRIRAVSGDAGSVWLLLQRED